MKNEVTYKDLVEAIERHGDKVDRSIKDLTEKIEARYVLKSEFEPVKNVVFGLVGLILIAVLGAFILSRIQVISYGHYAINKLSKKI